MTNDNRKNNRDLDNNFIPEGWIVVKLKDICDIKRGLASQHLTYVDIPSDGVRLIRINDFKSFDPKYIIKTSETEKLTLKTNDILIAGTGATAGISVLVKENWHGLPFSYNAPRIRVSEVVNPLFVFFFLNTRQINEQQKGLFTGNAQPFLDTKAIGNFKLLIPPIEEQQKIANILATVDEKIEVIGAQITETQQLKKGLMQRLLTKGIGHTKFKDSPLGVIPESWKVAKLGQVVSKVGSGITPKGGQEAYLASGILFIRSQNVLRGKLDLRDVAYISEEQHAKMSNSSISTNDVLLNITGASIGRSSVVPKNILTGNVNQHVCIIRPEKKLDPHFLCQFLNSAIGENQIDKFQAGGNREGLNYQQIRSFIIPLPKITEQKEIVNIFFSVDEKLDSLLEKKNKYQEFKKGLMQKLLTGKMRVKLSESEFVPE